MTASNAQRSPGRPRSEATHRAILDAAANLLEAEPYARITVERIAAEAKVGKQSIYRWWDGKADVLLEAYTERALKGLLWPEPTGAAIADLEALLAGFFGSIREAPVGRTIRGFIAEAQHDAEFRAKFHTRFVSTRRAMMRDIVIGGVARGELEPGLDVELVLDLVYGAFWYRLLSGTADPLDDAFARGIVATLAPVLRRRP